MFLGVSVTYQFQVRWNQHWNPQNASLQTSLEVLDSGLRPLGPPGPLHFGSGNLGSITHVVHILSWLVRIITSLPLMRATEVVQAPSHAA